MKNVIPQLSRLKIKFSSFNSAHNLAPCSKPQKGFTIIELLIATTIFSVILLLVASGLVNMGRAYYKTITASTTQEVTRNAIQEIVQEFELSGGFYRKLPTIAGGYDGFCIGNQLFSYKIGQKINLDGTGHALVVRNDADCDIAAGQEPDNLSVSNPSWRELLGPNMRLYKLDITESSTFKPEAISIDIIVLAGDDDLFDNNLVSPTTGLCKGGIGSQFCATSELKTYATRRLKVY